MPILHHAVATIECELLIVVFWVTIIMLMISWVICYYALEIIVGKLFIVASWWHTSFVSIIVGELSIVISW